MNVLVMTSTDSVFSLLLVHQDLWETAVRRKIPEAARATALPPARHSASCRREAGRCLHRMEVRRTEEQSREMSRVFRVGKRRGGGVGGGRRGRTEWKGRGLKRSGGADGGVRQGGGERGGRYGEELQLANGATAILPAAGRAGRCDRTTPFRLR